MRFLFHFPFELPAGATVTDVLVDRIPTAGTVAATRLATTIARLGHEAIVLDSRPSAVAAHVGGVTIEPAPDVAARARPDDALLILPPQSAISTLRALGARRCAVAFWLHNNLAADLLDDAFARGLDRIVSVSHPAAAVYDAYPWWSRIEAIPCSLRSEFPFTNNLVAERRVAFIGALGEAKGFHHILAAWPLVLARVPDATLEVFGSAALHHPSAVLGATGVMTADFEARHWRPERARNVRLRGAVPRTEFIRELQRARVAVVNPNLTGSTETFCSSAVEAQACGVPVVGAAAEGLLETVDDGRSGLLIRSQSPEELVGAIVRVLTDDALYASLAAGAFVHATRFRSPEREAQEWIAMAHRMRSGAPAARRRSTRGRLLGALGFGRVKLALKRRLRPHPELLSYPASR